MKNDKLPNSLRLSTDQSKESTFKSSLVLKVSLYCIPAYSKAMWQAWQERGGSYALASYLCFDQPLGGFDLGLAESPPVLGAHVRAHSQVRRLLQGLKEEWVANNRMRTKHTCTHTEAKGQWGAHRGEWAPPWHPSLAPGNMWLGNLSG